MNVIGGTADVSTYFVLRLAATGVEATGLTITNFDIQYVRTGTAPVAKVDATALVATDSLHADNKAIEIDATNQPGLYRVDWPDAAFAAGVKQVILTVKCATCFTEHMAVEIDPPVGIAASVSGAVGSVTGAVGSVTGNVGGNVVGTVASVVGAVASVTGAVGSVTGAVGSVTGAVGSVTGAVGSVTGGVTVTTNNDKTGYALSAAGVDAILDEAITEPAGVFSWASATLRNIVGWLGALSRNKITQTATKQTLRNDADDADIAESTVGDDGTTATRGEYT